MNELPVRIRQARLRAGLSQAALARQVGVKRSAATQWEHPRGTVPSMDHLIAVALATGVYLEWLATGRGAQAAEAFADAAQPSGGVAGPSPPAASARRRKTPAAPLVATDALETDCLQLLRAMAPSRRRMALEVLRAMMG